MISVFHFTRNHVSNYFEIISATLNTVAKYSWTATSLWSNL